MHLPQDAIAGRDAGLVVPDGGGAFELGDHHPVVALGVPRREPDRRHRVTVRGRLARAPGADAAEVKVLAALGCVEQQQPWRNVCARNNPGGARAGRAVWCARACKRDHRESEDATKSVRCD